MRSRQRKGLYPEDGQDTSGHPDVLGALQGRLHQMAASVHWMVQMDQDIPCELHGRHKADRRRRLHPYLAEHKEDGVSVPRWADESHQVLILSHITVLLQSDLCQPIVRCRLLLSRPARIRLCGAKNPCEAPLLFHHSQWRKLLDTSVPTRRSLCSIPIDRIVYSPYQYPTNTLPIW